jgi:hypothetical protein
VVVAEAAMPSVEVVEGSTDPAPDLPEAVAPPAWDRVAAEAVVEAAVAEGAAGNRHNMGAQR